MSLARRWLGWAEEDLTLAEHAAADPDVVRRGACTWAHQAAEKATKALLVSEGVDPPRIHDLTRLARLVAERQQPRLTSLELAELTRWAIEGRYPGDIEDASEADAHKALATARAVVAVSRTLIGSGDAPRPLRRTGGHRSGKPLTPEEIDAELARGFGEE